MSHPNPTSSILTTSSGNPVDDNHNSLTAGEYGPVLLQDFHLIDKLSAFDRERIPERVVHAKGAGAWGYFEVTHDVTKYSKAKLYENIGKRTPLFLRFSTVGGEKGSADTERDPRGFAIKHYTEEGNYDMVGNNTPVFFIRDPIKFPDFIHTQKRDPQTNLKCNNMVFDFWSQVPESAHQVTILFSDRGTPDGYRHMNGYSSHTFKWVNDKDEQFWVKLHYKTDSGIKNFSASKADQIKSSDPDYATRDLFNHIKNGNSATWSAYAQIMKYEDGFKYRWNIFDITKVWPQSDYPLVPIGKLVLNRNPENYFAETEQSAFSPSHLIPGIEPSLDKMLQGRLFSYPDTHRHRLGSNYKQIPINCPYRAKVSNNIRDGFMVVNGNQGSNKNYEPSTFHKYEVVPSSKTSQFRVTGLIGRYKPAHPNDDFAQPGTLFRKVCKDNERSNIVENLSGAMKGVNRDILERQLKVFYKCDPEYGDRIAKNLGLPTQKSHI